MVRKGKIRIILLLPSALIIGIIGWFIQGVSSGEVTHKVRKAPLKKVSDGIHFEILMPEEEKIRQR